MKSQDVYFIDGVRTPFGKAGEKGVFWNTRADDLSVKTVIGLLERHPDLPREAIDDVARRPGTAARKISKHLGGTTNNGSRLCN
jgi:acetyl-CoA acetyltransferase